jgi:hypothetical protein
MEHLKRSPTDPLTREPLRVEDLRPNLALKAACEEFLEENGWALSIGRLCFSRVLWMQLQFASCIISLVICTSAMKVRGSSTLLFAEG